MKNSLIAVGVFLLATAAIAYFAINANFGADKPGATSTLERDGVSALPGSLDVASKPQSDTVGAVEIATIADAYTDAEYEGFKEDYYCQLAATTRENCEAVDRGPQGNEQCLKMNQYYTYARHCGFQP